MTRESRPHRHEDELHDHDRGLSHDLPLLLSRRRALTVLGGVGLVSLTGCEAASSTGTAARSSAASAGGASSGEQIPEETTGPYPADGSNGRNVLSQAGVVRGDITSSFGTASGVVTGIPLTVTLSVLDTASSAAPLVGAAVYLWHATPGGEYSMYSQAIQAENYLRGVQETDALGQVTFTTVYPGAYDGRWPHLHFEVYPSLEAAVSASSRLRTSQLALPEAESAQVYVTDGYGTSANNLARSSLDTDMVFRDGYSLQLATVTGTVSEGMKATLNVPV